MTEQQLNEYSIFALRELARRVGVKSPTSKKKSQIIAEVLEIESGVREPNETKSKQGRPPKNFGYSFIDVLNPENSVFVNPKTSLTFNQTTPNFEYAESLDVCGYVEQINAHTSFLWVKNGIEFNCYFIPVGLVNQYGLKYGDFINAELGSGEERMLVKEILSINACPINKYTGKRAEYLNIAHVKPVKEMKFTSEFENLKIKFGESVYFYGVNNNENSEILINLLNSCNATRKLYLNLSIAEKNKYILDTANNMELFVADIMEGLEKSKKLISLAVERAKRLLEAGEDVVVVVDDVQSIWAIDESEHLAVKKLMSSTKAGKKGSISIFAIMNDDPQLKIFEKLADKRFKIFEKQLISR